MRRQRTVYRPRAERLGAGRYTYRTYLIEEVSRDAGETRPRWNISVAGQGAVDAAGSLREAKRMIDDWFAAVRTDTGKPLIEIL